jgi:S1-C subfamily serine protease
MTIANRKLKNDGCVRRVDHFAFCGLPLLTLLLVLHFAFRASPSASAAEPAADRRRTHVVEVFQANRDAVVNINTTQIIRQRFGAFEMDPFFRQFFRPMERDVKRTSLGSGFVIHSAGYIVTNAHVIEGADEVDVVFADGRHLSASILSADVRQDLAILKVEPPPGVALKAVVLGDAADLMIGEPVVAIGNPLGYQHSVTTGIISALNRELPVDNHWKLEGLIQTDTSINPGNSGGPLLNAYGLVIGIASAIRSDAQNIGFAIPVSRLRDLIPELLSPLQINRVDFGGQAVEQRIATPTGKPAVTLRWIGRHDKGGGTVFSTVAGKPVSSLVDVYVELLAAGKLGAKVQLAGGDKPLELSADKPAVSDGVRLARTMLGLELRELNPGEAGKLGLGRGRGLVVTAVETDGPADENGVKVGDVLVQLGRFRLSDLNSLASVLSQVTTPAPADVYIIRRGQLGRTRLTLRADRGPAL